MAWVRTVLLLTLLMLSLPAAAQEDPNSPISKGKFVFSGGAGFSRNSFSLGAGLGYFVIDGLMPGARYRYTRFSDDQTDDKASLHDLNVYVRYYFALSPTFYPFLVVDGGYLKMIEWGKNVEERSAELYSIMGGAGGAYYITPNFFIDLVVGMRHYFNPPTWSYIYTEPNQFEWGLGFGAAF